ncbi:Acyl-CoA N-acyltransferases (Nat) [Glarea lozoyensis ATCC 20868]|uniref:histone acetyltransferase n=1 Tax=Glarea lozoyensis (strain ATCC 20868 / MF5171) TaxID=1116229 RepID=S3DE00_GLAL2|nr:Acyl-CoA N-acyltransferases (Nat) [Glarea lozoyensis ATCC 20868]EPE35985.1 Acyl-CoA N-acyltransferases (Nat) [Glarea lozoyensis ATCC 20868]
MNTGKISAESANQKTTLKRAGAINANEPQSPARELLTPPTSSPRGLSDSSPPNKRVRDADEDDAEEDAPPKKKSQVSRSKSLKPKSLKRKEKSARSSAGRLTGVQKELAELSDALCRPLQGRDIARQIARIDYECAQKAISQKTDLRSEQNVSPRHALKAPKSEGSSEVKPEQPAAIQCSETSEKKESLVSNKSSQQEDNFKVDPQQPKCKAKKSAEPPVASTETGQRTVWARHIAEGIASYKGTDSEKYSKAEAAKRSIEKNRAKNQTRKENKQSQRKARQTFENSEYHNHAIDFTDTGSLSRSEFKKKKQAEYEKKKEAIEKDKKLVEDEKQLMLALEFSQKAKERKLFGETKTSLHLQDPGKGELFSPLLSHFTESDLREILKEDDLLQLSTEDNFKRFLQQNNFESLGKLPRKAEPVQAMPASTSSSPVSALTGLELKLKVSQKAKDQLKMENGPQNQKIYESRNVDQVVFGGLKFPAWFPAAYPPEVIGVKTAGANTITVPILHVCEKCFAYTVDVRASLAHKKFCSQNEVPGELTYNHQGKGIWKVKKVDGAAPESKLLLQRLSLFAKMYIESKSVFSGDEQIVGFFSKEKKSWNDYNLACIFILPPWQKKQLGRILTELSYEISKEKIGGPERPISDVGHAAYMRLWGKKIFKYLLDSPITDNIAGTGETNIELISKATGVSPIDCMDFFETLQNESSTRSKVLQMKRQPNVLEDFEKIHHHKYDPRDNSLICRWLKGTAKVNRLVIDQDQIRAWLAKNKIDVNEVFIDPRHVTVPAQSP